MHQTDNTRQSTRTLGDELPLYDRQRAQLAKVFGDARTARESAMTELRQSSTFDDKAYRIRMEDLHFVTCVVYASSKRCVGYPYGDHAKPGTLSSGHRLFSRHE